MKKILLGMVVMMSAMVASAQTIIFSEDFSDGIPSNWELIDKDGNTPYYSDFADGQCWIASDNGYILSSSWYSPAGTSNDWIVTPSVTLQAGAYLRWKAMAPDPQYSDGYDVYVIDGTDTTEIFSTSAENNDWTGRQYDLASYGTKSVKFAFVNTSTDKFFLYLDDIVVLVPASEEVEMVSASMTSPALLTGNTLTGVINNSGLNSITSYKVNYSVNGVEGTEQTVTKTVTAANTDEFTFTGVTLSEGENTIKVYVTELNGGSSSYVANDTTTITVNGVVSATDFEATSLTAPAIMTLDGNTATFRVTHKGTDTITTLTLSYDIDGGTKTDTTLSFSAFPAGYYYEVTFQGISFPSAGDYTINAHVTAVDGSADGNTANDKVSANVSVLGGSTDRVTLVEVITSTTCPPCATYVPPMYASMDTFPTTVVGLTYQGAYGKGYFPYSSWPMYQYDSLNVMGRSQWRGFDGYPTAWIDGGEGMHPYYARAAAMEAALASPAIFDISITSADYNSSTRTVDFSVDFTSLNELAMDSLAMQVALIQNKVEYDEQPGTNGETEFHNVMRGMYPDHEGTAMATSLDADEKTTVTGSISVNGDIVDVADLKLVAFVEDRSEASKKVLQAGATEVGGAVSAKEVAEFASAVSVFPTVATEELTVNVSFETAVKNLEVTIVNALGQTVATVYNSSVEAGNTSINANVANFEQGYYFVNITAEGVTKTERFVVGK